MIRSPGTNRTRNHQQPLPLRCQPTATRNHPQRNGAAKTRRNTHTVSDLPTRGLNLLPFAEHALTVIAGFFDQNSIALPTRQYIGPGVPSLDAWDCEQLMVGCVGITDASPRQGAVSTAPPAGGPYSATSMRAVTYAIQLVRCAPGEADGYSPDPGTVNTAGRQQLLDMGCLSQAVVNLCSAPPDWLLTGAKAMAGPVVPIGPSGGYTALEASVTLSAFGLLTGTETP
jgi:hypothetical protein